MKRYKKILLGIGIGVILVLIIVLNLSSPEGGVKVRMTKVRIGSIVSKVSATGELRAQSQVNISAEVMGKVERLYVKEGEWVEKGQLLCLLDQTRYRADLNLAKARFLQAQKNFKRTQALFKDSLVSQKTYEDALTELEIAKAQYEEAMDNLEKTEIRAPISGRVVKLNIEEGETVIIGTMNNPGTIMMTIADLSKMLAIVEVDETEIADIHPGEEAEIRIDAFPDTIIKGKVERVGYMPIQSSSISSERETNFEVRIDILGTSPLLRPGMSVSADIITARKDSVLVIPIQAMGKREIKGKKMESVFVVKNGIARLRPIKTGKSSETEIEVIKGLKPGETIITGPYKVLASLKDGDRVKGE